MKKHFLLFFCILLLANNLFAASDDLFEKAKPQNYTVADTLIITKLYREYFKYRQSEPLRALEILQKGIDIAENIDHKEKTGWLLYHKGYVYRQLGIYNLSALSYLKSLEIYEKTGESNFSAWIMIDIGNLYLDEKVNLKAGLEHFEKARKIFEKQENKIGTIVSDYCIGQIYLEKNSFDKAFEYFNEAAVLSRGIKEYRHEVISLSYIGKTYLKSGKLDEALKTFKDELQLSLRTNNILGIGNSNNDLAEFYEGQANLIESIHYHFKALEAYKKVPDMFKIAGTLNKIGKVYATQGDLKSAMEFSRNALAVADSNNIISLKESVLPLLADYASKLNRDKEAFSYLRKYTELTQSNISRNAQQVEHEYELQLLNKEKLLTEEKVLKQKVITYVSFASIAVFIFLLGMIYKKNRKLKDSYEHLYNNFIQLGKKEEELSELKKQTKYESSSLRDKDQSLMLEKLISAMDQEKMFLRNDLSLDSLAKELDTNRSYLSQIINDQYGMNYNNYVNEYRVREAQRLLLDPAQKKLTIEAIAQNVGFNSKSSFNQAFKKITGLTPSEFVDLKDKN